MKTRFVIKVAFAALLVAHLWWFGAYTLIAIVVDNWFWPQEQQTPHFVLAALITLAGTLATMPGLIDRWRRPTRAPKPWKA